MLTPLAFENRRLAVRTHADHERRGPRALAVRSSTPPPSSTGRRSTASSAPGSPSSRASSTARGGASPSCRSWTPPSATSSSSSGAPRCAPPPPRAPRTSSSSARRTAIRGRWRSSTRARGSPTASSRSAPTAWRPTCGRSGSGPRCRSGLSLERSPALVVGLLGIWKAGGAYVPLDPSYPSERLAFLLEDSLMPVLVAEERLLDRLPAAGFAQLVLLDADGERIARSPAVRPAPAAVAENLAYAIYTSGSTGRPKGVLGRPRRALRLSRVGGGGVRRGGGRRLARPHLDLLRLDHHEPPRASPARRDGGPGARVGGGRRPRGGAPRPPA